MDKKDKKKESNRLIEAFAEFAIAQNIDKPTVIRILEDAFRCVVKQKYGYECVFEILISLDLGDIQILRYRDIVADEIQDIKEATTIKLSDARTIEGDFEIGEQVVDEIFVSDFGRRIVYTIKVLITSAMQGLREGALLKKYENRIGDLVTLEVKHSYNRELILVDEDGYELILPKNQQIHKDRFRRGDVVKSVVHEIVKSRNKNVVIVSRTSPKFLQALMEYEIPEIREGILEIKKVVREPGERAKVVVHTYSDNIDPIGACVGIRGTRIHGIVRELQNENIDIVSHTLSIDLLITRSLSPAKISSIEHRPGNRIAVYFRPDQISKAIGTGGYNISLTSKLIGAEIDVYRDLKYGEDHLLDDLVDYIGEDNVLAFKEIGFNTAKEVLQASPDEIKSKVYLSMSFSGICKILSEKISK